MGTASAAMEQLKARELIPLIKALTQPVLGICLGMQILASLSEEGHNIPLLGLVDGNINKLDTKGLPLPHMGWDQVLANPLTLYFAILTATLGSILFTVMV